MGSTAKADVLPGMRYVMVATGGGWQTIGMSALVSLF
jgi:hypothetical protein